MTQNMKSEGGGGALVTTRSKLTATPTTPSAQRLLSRRQRRASSEPQPRWVMSSRRTEDADGATNPATSEPRAREQTDGVHEMPSSPTKETAAQATKVRLVGARRCVRDSLGGV